MVLAHNLEAMNTNRQYGIVAKNKNKASEKLASGYKINRAADNAAGLAISEKMRSQIKGLDQAAENVRDGYSLTNVADGAIHEIHSLMQRQRELLVQAANDTYTDSDRETIDAELTFLAEELDRIYEETEFNTIKIFKGGEEYIFGPVVTSDNSTTTVIRTPQDQENKEYIWLPDTEIPQDDVHIVTSSRTIPHATYSEHEEVIDTDEVHHETILFTSDYTNTLVTTTKTDTISTTYEDLTPQISLREPGEMVRDRGYIDVYTNKMDGVNPVHLSCAMSHLAVKVDGVFIGSNSTTYNSSKDDLYTNDAIKADAPVVSPDKSTVTTTFHLGNGVLLSQKVVLKGGDTYDISYSVQNTDKKQHDVEIRFAFDVLNTTEPDRKPLLDTHKYGTSFTVEGIVKNGGEDIDAKIGIQTTGTKDCCLGSINDLYGTFENPVIDGQKVGHVGLGCWWSTNAKANSGPIQLGGVTYGPFQLKKKLYRKTDIVKSEIKIVTNNIKEHTEARLRPRYLDIQAGANSMQIIPVRLWNLSLERLKCRVPEEISVFNASESLVHLDRVIDKMSMIRAYYGAVANIMEHAENNARNTSENTQAAESRIRDTDMADEMVAFSKENILQQAAAAMLTQANQSKRGVLDLLNG